MISVLLLVAFFITLLVYITFWYWRTISHWSRRLVMGPKPHWLYGNLDGLRKQQSLNDIFDGCYQQFQGHSVRLLGVYLFVWPGVLVTDRHLAKRILTKDFRNFRNRGMYHNTEDLSGNLFTHDYEKWRMFRTKLSSSFSNFKLKAMLPTFVKASQELIYVMEKDLELGNTTLDVKDLMLRFTIEIIATCAFGLQTNSLRNPNCAFAQITEKANIGEDTSILAKFIMLCFPNVARILRLRYMPQYMVELYIDMVRNILELRSQHKIRYNDIMDTLNDMRLQDPSKLSLKEMAAQTLIFFQAGYETSAYTLTYALYELAHHEEVQQEARLEILKTLDKYNHKLTYECLGEMVYLEQIINETLRLYPASPLIIRQCTEDYRVAGTENISIDKGQMVIIPVYSLQRDKRYYSHPNNFNPDNFRPDSIDSESILSFGDGPRNCIGRRFAKMQITIGLINLLRKFKFQICESTPNPIEFKNSSVLLSPKNEIYLKVEKIQN
ncbi:cytochrome P450 6a9 [Stomoxys calcitrans]|uniref:cytochrome P450 6a9 n=1 Tax=Stomoxys calcitrans TaxID=35570 RepID=UPI0027E39FB3|nr:cytochrome P450 6a9 [Stomoxys calcitrans]